MATERFERLPQEKKDRILRAAIKEFSRVSFDKASINKIIKDAGIPRGSFYQYFQDKQDLQRYLVESFIRDRQQDIYLFMKENRGSLFDFFLSLYDRVEEMMDCEDFKLICKNAIFTIRNEQGRWMPSETYCEEQKQKMNDFLTFFRDNYYPAAGISEIEMVYKMMVALAKDHFMQLFLCGRPWDEAREEFGKEAAIIETGFLQQLKERENA
ncbi:MAG: TetR/AcrR family transcriptional regulator [Lachnospiraceae bacterium]|nr:TetR/AcrR family transcriptional regulator [Lachnospiraceae bacterium]